MRKFYRIHDESKIFGVCSGIGNYTKTDPLIWRIIFFFLIFSPIPIITGYIVTSILTKIV